MSGVSPDARWSNADLAMLRDLLARHSPYVIARKLPAPNGKAGRPAHNREDVMVNSLDFCRAVMRKLDAGVIATKDYEQVAAEARARGVKASARSVRAMFAKAEQWMNERHDVNSDLWRSAMRILYRFHNRRDPLRPMLIRPGQK